MDQERNGLSQGNSVSSGSSSLNPHTLRNCPYCRNHGSNVSLKGHKHYCPKRECKCDKCGRTAERQKNMARQVAMRRAWVQDEARFASQVGSSMVATALAASMSGRHEPSAPVAPLNISQLLEEIPESSSLTCSTGGTLPSCLPVDRMQNSRQLNLSTTVGKL